MKKNILAVLISCCLFAACNNTKKTTTAMADSSILTGTWELNYISGPRIAFDSLYPNKTPTITFDVVGNRVSGNTSCNNFTGSLKADGNKISFTDPMALTRMICMDGNGENVFLETIKKINTWSVTDGNTLNLIMDDIALMRFTKR